MYRYHAQVWFYFLFDYLFIYYIDVFSLSFYGNMSFLIFFYNSSSFYVPTSKSFLIFLYNSSSFYVLTSKSFLISLAFHLQLFLVIVSQFCKISFLPVMIIILGSPLLSVFSSYQLLQKYQRGGPTMYIMLQQFPHLQSLLY